MGGTHAACGARARIRCRTGRRTAGLRRSHRGILRSLLLFALVLAASCSSFEEKRIRQLLNEKGFGSRAEGVATVQNYVRGGDGVVFLLDPATYLQPGAEQLALLISPQQVGIDGTILVPYVGRLPILGLTEKQLEDLMIEQLGPLFNFELRLQARIIDGGKFFFAFGEVLRKGRLRFPQADYTLLEAVTDVSPGLLANIGRIHLIRPDAENPLVMVVNFREMVLTGNTTYNVAIQDNDIIYVPPTFFGMLARFLERLLAPLNSVVAALFGLSNLQWSYDILTDSDFRRNSFFRF